MNQFLLNIFICLRLCFTRLVFLTFFIALSSQAYPLNQARIIKKYTAEDGLISNYIQSLFKDSRGFLWVGTRSGLQRFDGFVFKTYYTGMNIRHIVESREGNIVFCGSDGRINQVVFSGKQSFIQCIDSSGQGKEHVRGLYCDSSGIWVLSMHLGLKVFRADGAREMLRAEEVKLRGLYSFCTSPLGMIVAGQDGTINILVPGKKSLRVLKRGAGIAVAVKCYGEYLWLSCENGVQRLHIPTSVLENVSLGPPDEQHARWTAYHILESGAQAAVYVNSNHGLIFFEKESHHFQDIVFLQADGFRLGNIWATALLFQEENTGWLGTENGLLKFTSGSDGLRTYSLNDYTDEKLPVKLRCIYEIGKDSFLAGSSNNNGVYLLVLKATGLSVQRFYYPLNLPVNTINVIRKDKMGRIWMGTNDDLLLFDAAKKKLTRFPHVSFVWDILPVDKGLWCAARENGIIYFKPENGEQRKYVPGGHLAGVKIWQIIPYRNVLLMATTQGLHYFNTHTGKFDYGMPALDVLLPRLKDRLWHLEWMNEDVLAITCESEGLMFLDLKKGELSNFQFEKRNFYGFAKDNSHHLWIVSDRGIVFFDTRLKKFCLPGNEPVFSNGNFSFRGMFKRGNGEMIFAGDHGFTLFSPEKIPFNGTDPRIHITSLAVSGNEYSDFLENGSALEFEHTENNLSFRFADLSLTQTSGGRFRYWLKGSDSSWSEPDQASYVIYRNLPAGDYSFYVTAEGNHTEVTSLKPLLTFRIVPPVWKRTWFMILAGFLAAGSISLLLVLRFRSLKRGYLNEQLRLESEIKALRAQINPHFIFNALSSIQYFVLNNQGGEANQYLARFAVLMRKVLDYSSRQTIPLQDEIQLLSDYLEMEKMRFEDRMEWTVSVAGDIFGTENIPTLLLQPLVENAVVHGIGSRKQGGRISLSFIRKQNYIHCVIKDNGAGMQQKAGETDHASRGILMLKERLEYINRKYKCQATMSFLSQVDQVMFPGMEVHIQLPVLTDE